MALCRICHKNDASLPEGGGEPRYCSRCWDTRVRQLFHEEDRFHIQRLLRSSEAEKYLVYHDDHQEGAEAVGVVFAVLDRVPDHLEISAFLSDKLDWKARVPFIYEEGVECEVELMDVFLGLLENDLAQSWRCTSWTAEVTLCTGEPFWVDSRDREATDGEESDAEEEERE
jgi:hypothetical protein